jgi:3-carboxy-cis,cis-muconate cycloisomerase
MQHLYQSVFYSEKVNSLFTDEAIISYMLRFEGELAKAQAKHNVIPVAAAETIEECCKVENINIAQLTADAGLGGNVNILLVKQLTAVVKQKNSEAAKYVHIGATSQDVIDTAMMLQARDAVSIIEEELKQLVKQLVLLVEEHRNTVMIGRSFMQHARPITFGYKVAGWLDALVRSQKAIEELLQQGFALQLGGAVGTLSGMYEKGLKESETMSELLALNNPSKPWHTERDRFVTIAYVLGILAGNLGKIAKDISLLMQTEIAEVFEPSANGKGGSSTMPHKRNPVGCIAILANATRIPGLVATMFSCMIHDHERATGSWHAEWETFSDIIKLTAGAVSKAVELTNGLEVDVQRMLVNLELTNGLIYAENISMALAEKVGKADAHHLIEQCCSEALFKGVHLKDIVIKDKVITKELSKEKIEEQCNSFKSVGLSSNYISQVLKSV